MKDDSVLITWLVLSVIWDIIVFGFTSYEVFWHGRSGWWFLFAILLTLQFGLYKALYKKFDISWD